MIPPKLIAIVRDIRQRFLQAVALLDQSASFSALKTGSVTLNGEWEELKKLANSPRLARECSDEFTCAIVGSSSHGKTSVLQEMFPSLAERGWLVTDATDTTSQALVIRRSSPGDGLENEVVVRSWKLEQIKRLVRAAETENARLNIRIAYRPDSIEVDGQDATFTAAERRQFKFAVQQKLSALPRTCVLGPKEREDKALIRALTVKESTDRVSNGPILTIDGQPFHALQLRAAVKEVELRDPFSQLAKWSKRELGELSGFVFIDTPGLNVMGSIKDEVLRSVLGKKNQQIVVELIRDDELDLIVHLVLAGQQSAFAQLWGPLNQVCSPDDLLDLSERLVLVINGANILLTNDDLARKWDPAIAQTEGDPYSVVVESNVLKKMSEVGSFRPAKICFVDSQRIVEKSSGVSYEQFYARHRKRLDESVSPTGVGYGTLQRLGIADSFRENIAALCDPDDRGQGFLIRQLQMLIRDHGPRLFVRKHIVRSKLGYCIKKIRKIVSRHYDAEGRLNRHAILAAVRACFPHVTPDDPDSIEVFYQEHLKSEIDGLVPGPGEAVEPDLWVYHSFNKLCQLLYSKAKPPNVELREVFKKYSMELMGQWRARWGYKSAELPPPTRKNPDSAALLRHSFHLHIREMLYQLVSGDGSDVHAEQNTDDQNRIRAVALAAEQLDRLSESLCTEHGVKP